MTRIRLTEDGCAARERVQATFVELIEAGLGSMSEKDRTELARLLNMFGENISSAL